MEQFTGKLLIGVREAAKRLSISERMLWQLTQRGVVKHVRMGRRVLYDPQDLRATIDSLRQPGRDADECSPTPPQLDQRADDPTQ